MSMMMLDYHEKDEGSFSSLVVVVSYDQVIWLIVLDQDVVICIYSFGNNCMHLLASAHDEHVTVSEGPKIIHKNKMAFPALMLSIWSCDSLSSFQFLDEY